MSRSFFSGLQKHFPLTFAAPMRHLRDRQRLRLRPVPTVRCRTKPNLRLTFHRFTFFLGDLKLFKAFLAVSHIEHLQPGFCVIGRDVWPQREHDQNFGCLVTVSDPTPKTIRTATQSTQQCPQPSRHTPPLTTRPRLGAVRARQRPRIPSNKAVLVLVAVEVVVVVVPLKRLKVPCLFVQDAGRNGDSRNDNGNRQPPF